ncbi:Protein of unknown function [Halopseudomonas litoralis]|uniref:DUF1565 domain-containing protein n=1 Tax=Halopseudomonas litoralis TaxID=797277 RepID=A0A1H1NYZ7_9GAMM|nr:DUF1565 domain-containing protein [Halopseudomonas litoralis]SDS04177.1 Protein of unknown function [Halopseudomonas litoralis]
MSRNNTGNPIDSMAFADFEDNVKNFDEWSTSEADTLKDRKGEERLTLRGTERAGAGDTSVAVDAAARAVAAAGQVEADAEQIAQEAAQQAVDSVVVAVDGAVVRAEDAADRAETSASSAIAASNTYSTTAVGIAETVSGQYFLLSTADPQVFDLYLNSSGTAILQSGQFSVAGLGVAGPIPLNLRINGFALRDGFVQGEVIGPVSATTLTPQTGIGWDVVGGALTLDGNGSFTQARLWSVGHHRSADFALDLTMRQTITTEIPTSAGSATGPLILIGDTAAALLGVYWINTGVMYQSTGNRGSGGATTGPIPGLQFTAGQELQLRMAVREDGSGFAVATNLSSGFEHTLTFTTPVPAGRVWLGWTRAYAGAISHLVVRYPDALPEDENYAGQIADIDARVDSLTQQIDINPSSEPTTAVTAPEGFLFRDYGFRILRGLHSGRITTDINPQDYKASAVSSIYIDRATGDDSNPGTAALPFRTVSAALVAVNAGGQPCDVTISGGEYTYEDIGAMPILTQSVNLVCMDPVPAVLSLSARDLLWSPTSGRAGVFEATPAAAAPLWGYDKSNLDPWGEEIPFTPVSSVDLVESTPNSCFVEGGVIYVQTHNSRVPDGSIRVLLDVDGLNAGATKYYIENVHILGGKQRSLRCTNMTDDTKADSMTYRCRFSYSYANACYGTLRRLGRLYAVQCVASWARAGDGFSYTTSGIRTTDIVEIDCIGHDNGRFSGRDNNGSSIHHAGRIIRINGDYPNNIKNIADTGDGSQTWMVNSSASDSTDESGSEEYSINFIFSGGEVKAWLDTCVSRGGSVVDFYVGEGAQVFVRNTDVSNMKNNAIKPGGLLAPY